MTIFCISKPRVDILQQNIGSNMSASTPAYSPPPRVRVRLRSCVRIIVPPLPPLLASVGNDDVKYASHYVS